MRSLFLFACLSACAVPSAATGQGAVPPAVSPPPPRTDPAHQPHELGRVAWIRDLYTGRLESRRTGKPILLLFTEVPGCSTVNGFADAALEHPVLVEVIETHFVPVAVYNNTSGDRDDRTRQRFDEPAWNNPVVRILDAELRPLAPRYATGWTAAGLARTMVTALDAEGREVPRALRSVAGG